jgi:hypothetical protein
MSAEGWDIEAKFKVENEDFTVKFSHKYKCYTVEEVLNEARDLMAEKIKEDADKLADQIYNVPDETILISCKKRKVEIDPSQMKRDHELRLEQYSI